MLFLKLFLIFTKIGTFNFWWRICDAFAHPQRDGSEEPLAYQC